MNMIVIIGTIDVTNIRDIMIIVTTKTIEDIKNITNTGDILTYVDTYQQL